MGRNDRCWAEGVSECRGGLSGEHYVSRGLFQTPRVTVEGLRGEEPMTIGINSLTARCLCSRHNSELSHLDDAAVDVANALRRLNEIRRSNEVIPRKKRTTLRLEVSGALLERWALKATAGYAHVKRVVIGGATGEWRPSLNFAHAAFGTAPLPDDCGLRTFPYPGERLHLVDRWTLAMGKRPLTTTPPAVSCSGSAACSSCSPGTRPSRRGAGC